MKVVCKETRKLIDVNESYASRLMEQGKAVLPPKGAAPSPTPKAEEKKPVKGKRGEI